MKLPAALQGTISALYVIINTLFWTTPLFAVTALRIVIPFKFWRKICGKAAIWIAESWVFFNNLGIHLTRNMEFEVIGLENVSRKEWYLVVSNHQSWVDIPVLQKVFYKKIPFLKFFLKKELIWVPVLGPAWWALDFPFMKRYTPQFLKKHPHLKGKDIEITRKACEKFKDNPVSVMNFIEGTRFTPAKQERQKSPFNHLLKPKAGGVGFVMSAMGEQLSSILSVTVFYPDGAEKFWDFLCGKIRKVKVTIEKLPVTDDLLGNYTEDKDYRVSFQRWLNDLWQKKDDYLQSEKNVTAKSELSNG